MPSLGVDRQCRQQCSLEFFLHLAFLERHYSRRNAVYAASTASNAFVRTPASASPIQCLHSGSQCAQPCTYRCAVKDKQADAARMVPASFSSLEPLLAPSFVSEPAVACSGRLSRVSA